MTESLSLSASVGTSPSGSTPAAAVSRRRIWRQVLRRPAGAIAAGWILLMIAGALLAPWIAPYGYDQQDLLAAFSLPSAEHWLGTDHLGRDILSRILFGARISLLAVAYASAVFVLLGLASGLVAGYAGGWIDRALMRWSEIIMAIPLVVTLLVVLAIFSRNEIAAMITFGMFASAGLTRIVRNATAECRSDDYVQAAVIAGLAAPQVVMRHVLPRIMPPVLIQTAILAGSALLVESGLNFLGLGVQPPAASWGGLVADASSALFRQPWMLVPAGAIITLTALAFGVIGDVARDATADRSELGARSWRETRTEARRVADDAATHAGGEDLPLLSAKAITVGKSDLELVSAVDLEVSAGEIIGIVGESGCGKSMLVSALLRLLPPGIEVSAEHYELDGTDILSLTERGMVRIRGGVIGYIPQEPVAGLDPSFTVGAQLRELVRHHRRTNRAQTEARVRELLSLVQLPDVDRVLRLYPYELSGGMAQRVAIARSLIGEPRVLIADEPTTALDVTVQAEILDLLRTLRDREGLAVLLVTHDWGVVADICDRALVLYAGQVVEEGSVEALFAAPRHPYTRALREASPAAAGFRHPLRSIPGSVPPPGMRGPGCYFANRCPRAQAACLAGAVPLAAPAAHSHPTRCLFPEPGPATAEEVNDVTTA